MIPRLPAGGHMAFPFEVLNPRVRRGPFRAALFDFDGTLSLIREGWPRVMIGMMVERLRGLALAAEPADVLWGLVERFVMELNGHPTVVQMERFAREIQARGGAPEPADVYLADYLDRLMRVVRQRWDVLERGIARPAAWVVPNAHAILDDLQTRGVPVYLASGTDLDAVRYEGALLDVLAPFGPRVYAPHPADPTFSKGRVADDILTALGIRGEQLVGFGDGVVETKEVKRVGGVMVGVASAEPGESGVHPGKRERLAAAGADVIVPDYGCAAVLLRWLWGE